MSESYAKLFSTITLSTIWGAPLATRVVWITMLAMADRNGDVMASVPGLARIANVSLEECEQALDLLRSPDRYSRTPEHEGRRIVDVHGGWRLLNYAAYRERMSRDDRREQQRQWVADKRAKERATNGDRKKANPKDVDNVDKSTVSTHTEAEVDAEAIPTSVARHTHLAPESAGGVCDDVPPVQVGQFEGHIDPPPRPIQATPAVIAAVALRKLGYLDVHGQHPGLCDAMDEGVTLDHLQAIGERYAGKGKPGSYVITAARREHAERGTPVPVGGTHGGFNADSSLLARVAEHNAALDAIDPDLQRPGRADDGALVHA